jgi:predicted  nucleic acid-binding Zn-ribbon protein
LQEEIAALQDELRGQGQQLAAERRTEMAKAAELRRLKCENETLSERTAALEEEFSRYKVSYTKINEKINIFTIKVNTKKHYFSSIPTNKN